MELSQRKQREILLQLLFSWTFCSNKIVIEESVPVLMELLSLSKKQVSVVKEKLYEMIDRLEEIDQMIKESSLTYSLDRISEIDKNVLRIGIYEGLFEHLDVGIVIDEGIRLARKFSSPESANFVHAVLDTTFKKRACESTAV